MSPDFEIATILDGKAYPEVSVYFDTDNHKLRRSGLMLRVRRVGSRYLQTIKASGHLAPFERDEWEAEIASQEPDLSLAQGTALEPLMTKKLRRRLKPLFETRVRRTTYPINDDKHAILLTVDRGTIDTGTRSAPLCELELELKRGTVTELFDVARELTRALPARVAVKSKSERGYEIIDNKKELPAKASPTYTTKHAPAQGRGHPRSNFGSLADIGVASAMSLYPRKRTLAECAGMSA